MNYKTDKKAAIFMADGCEEIEALTVVDILYRAGIPLTKVSISDSLSVTSSHEVTFLTDTTVSLLDFDEYDMLILPGGMPGTIHLDACRRLTEQVTAFAKAGKQIAAICAGLLQGKKATCNPSKEGALKEGGAILTYEQVTVTDNIITSQAMGTAIPFALAIVAHYLGQETADALRENIIYKPQ